MSSFNLIISKFILLMFLILNFPFLFAQSTHSAKPDLIPEKTWVFILAGQSNMAGRGALEAIDTTAVNGIYTINDSSEIIKAKEPLHFYEPKMKGVGPGFAFARELKNNIDSTINILLIPTAVGGSSINQWLADSNHRSVNLLSNFNEKITMAKQIGTIKAILWIQGESDLKPLEIEQRQLKMDSLFTSFRKSVNNDTLPVLMGEIGKFLKNAELATKLNSELQNYVTLKNNVYLIKSDGLTHRGDFLHFNSASQHELGKRFAEAYLKNVITY